MYDFTQVTFHKNHASLAIKLAGRLLLEPKLIDVIERIVEAPLELATINPITPELKALAQKTVRNTPTPKGRHNQKRKARTTPTIASLILQHCNGLMDAPRATKTLRQKGYTVKLISVGATLSKLASEGKIILSNTKRHDTGYYLYKIPVPVMQPQLPLEE
jgi:hypothetical protein